MMRCATAREWMTQGLREPLVPDQQRELGRHLERCAACRGERDALEQFDAALSRSVSRQRAAEPIPVQLNARRIALQASEKTRLRGKQTVWFAGTAFGCAAAALLVTVHPWHRHSPGPSDMHGTSAAAIRPADPSHAPGTADGARDAGAGHDPLRPLAWVSRGPKGGGKGAPSGPARVVANSRARPAVPDAAYLDGTDAGLTSQWMTGRRNDPRVRAWLLGNLPSIKDDFVHVPLPQIASADPKDAAARDALKQYEKEAAVVDPRLFRKVTVQLKAAPLSEVCDALARETGVRVAASRGVADENATVLVKDRPAREVMREVARLFGYKWARAGAEGAYTYELLQDLRGQLAEEEMRNQDGHAALLALDQAMLEQQSLLNLSREELKTRAAAAKGRQKELLQDLQGQGWGAAQLYFRLSPAQRSALAAGETLTFSTHPDSPDLQLPDEMRRRILQGREITLGTFEGQEALVERGFGEAGVPVADLPDAYPTVTLHMERSELGQLTLSGHSRVYLANKPNIKSMFWAGAAKLASASSPSVTNPENARANASLAKLPEFQQTVSIKPEPSCNWYRPGGKPQDRAGFEVQFGDQTVFFGPGGLAKADAPHVQAADVWEALHRATGRPIIADAYSHVYDQDQVTVEKTSLFDALCRVGDTMHARWHKDDDYLLARSTSFYWDKLKEVPVRYLRRWQEDHKKQGVVPLDDVLEMATMTDAQLNASFVGYTIGHCWNLEEWGMSGTGGAFRLGLPGGRYLRTYLRFLAQLSPAQRQQALRGYLGWQDLRPGQREELARILLRQKGDPQALNGIQLHVDYAPVGTYLWHPVVDTSKEVEEIGGKWPILVGNTAEAVLTAARKIQPSAEMGNIKKSRGTVAVTFRNARGDLWSEGGPGVAWGRK